MALQNLPFAEREWVRRELIRSSWEQRFDALVNRIQANVASDPDALSDEEIDAEVESVRSARFAAR
ncbi:MAG: hypothetical protein KIH69_010105 [Anaerolineae bacterium]|nr:hypothetical protein [Anaerolineae bacterium]